MIGHMRPNKKPFVIKSKSKLFSLSLSINKPKRVPKSRTVQASRRASLGKWKGSKRQPKNKMSIQVRFLCLILSRIEKNQLSYSWSKLIFVASSMCNNCTINDFPERISPIPIKKFPTVFLESTSIESSLTCFNAKQSELEVSIPRTFDSRLVLSCQRAFEIVCKITVLRVSRAFDMIFLSRQTKVTKQMEAPISSSRKPCYSRSTAFKIMYSRLEKFIFLSKLRALYSLMNF